MKKWDLTTQKDAQIAGGKNQELRIVLMEKKTLIRNLIDSNINIKEGQNGTSL